VFVVPAGTFALKGTVREQLTDAVVAGARVQVLSGNAVVLDTTTGTDGRYQLYGVAPRAGLRVSKEGYLDDHQPLEIVGHTTLDVYLTELGLDTYTGVYTLTLEFGGWAGLHGAPCAIPEEARTRTYTARIEEFQGTTALVTLSDATFASGCGTNALAPGLGCNQFLAQKHGDGLEFTMSLYDGGEGGQITERLADGTWLYIWGIASGHFEGSILQAAGRGEAFYCPVSQESAWGQCVTRFCETGEFRLRF
jgi:hypothetical protein